MLGGAVDNAAHALLHGAVLRVDADNAGVVHRPLHLPVQHVVVVPVAEWAVLLVQRLLEASAATPLLVGPMRVGAQVPRPGVVVVNGHPRVAAVAHAAGVGVTHQHRRDHGVEGRQELGYAPVLLPFLCVALGAHHEAVISLLDGEGRRAVARCVLLVQRLGGIRVQVCQVAVQEGDVA